MISTLFQMFKKWYLIWLILLMLKLLPCQGCSLVFYWFLRYCNCCCFFSGSLWTFGLQTRQTLDRILRTLCTWKLWEFKSVPYAESYHHKVHITELIDRVSGPEWVHWSQFPERMPWCFRVRPLSQSASIFTIPLLLRFDFVGKLRNSVEWLVCTARVKEIICLVLDGSFQTGLIHLKLS